MILRAGQHPTYITSSSQCQACISHASSDTPASSLLSTWCPSHQGGNSPPRSLNLLVFTLCPANPLLLQLQSGLQLSVPELQLPQLPLHLLQVHLLPRHVGSLTSSPPCATYEEFHPNYPPLILAEQRALEQVQPGPVWLNQQHIAVAHNGI